MWNATVAEESVLQGSVEQILLVCSREDWVSGIRSAIQDRNPAVEIVVADAAACRDGIGQEYSLGLVDATCLEDLAATPGMPPQVFCLGPIPAMGAGWRNSVLEHFDSREPDWNMLAVTVLDRLENLRLRDQLARLIGELECTRRIDTETGLPTALHFQNQLEHEIFRANRYGVPLTVLLFEVDHFDLLASDPGVSSALVRPMAAAFSRSLRNCDLLGSFGAGVFGALLSDTRLLNGIVVAEKLRRVAGEFRPPRAAADWLPQVTLSIGVAEYGASSADAPGLLRTLHELLAAARAAGGNCVRTAEAV